MSSILKPHQWAPVKESKGVYGYHEYRCENCGETTHIGLDIDYSAPVCEGKRWNQKHTKSQKTSSDLTGKTRTDETEQD